MSIGLKGRRHNTCFNETNIVLLNKLQTQNLELRTQNFLHQSTEKIIPLVIYKDESGEIFHLYLPDGFHPQFRIIQAFHLFNIFFGQQSRRTSDKPEVESPYFLQASVTCFERFPLAIMIMEPPFF